MGLPCIGCGGTRAAKALLAGDPVVAWRANPLVPVGLVAAGVAVIADCVAQVPHWLQRIRKVTDWSVFGAAMALFIARLLEMRGVL